MKANQVQHSLGINRSDRKENHFLHEYAVMSIERGEIAKKISCRIYGTQAKSYCCVWISTQKDMVSGSGSAGGYGYHRVSAAVEQALQRAGFILVNDNGKRAEIAGVGETVIKEALLAISLLLEYDRPQIFEAHA